MYVLPAFYCLFCFDWFVVCSWAMPLYSRPTVTAMLTPRFFASKVCPTGCSYSPIMETIHAILARSSINRRSMNAGAKPPCIIGGRTRMGPVAMTVTKVMGAADLVLLACSLSKVQSPAWPATGRQLEDCQCATTSPGRPQRINTRTRQGGSAEPARSSPQPD